MPSFKVYVNTEPRRTNHGRCQASFPVLRQVGSYGIRDMIDGAFIFLSRRGRAQRLRATAELHRAAFRARTRCGPPRGVAKVGAADAATIAQDGRSSVHHQGVPDTPGGPRKGAGRARQARECGEGVVRGRCAVSHFCSAGTVIEW